MSPPPLMIFAAGFGTRMRPLTDDRPKPLLHVAGRTLLDRAIALGRDAGARRIVVNAHYRAAQIADHLAGSGIAVSVESPAILDTGGGLCAALGLLDPQGGPVATLNPDAVWTGQNPLAALMAAWDRARMDALVMLVPHGSTRGRVGGGDFVAAAATATAPGAITARPGPLVYGGAQIIDPACLAPIPDPIFSLNRVWDAALARGRLFGLVHAGLWCDVGRPETIPLAAAMLADG